MTEAPHLTCQQMLAVLSDYIEGQLPEDLCTAIERHMEQCHNCYVVVDSLRKTVILYQRLDRPDVPEDVTIRLYRTLNLEEFLSD